MEPVPESAAAGVCPAPETLVEFHLGKLPIRNLESVAVHVSSCHSCEAQLSELRRRASEDSFVDQLKRCMDQPAEPDEPAYARMAVAAAAIPITATDATASFTEARAEEHEF